MRKIRVLDNVYDLITVNMEDRFKDNVAFRFYDTANDAVTTILYKDYVQDIRKAVNYFQSSIPEIKVKKICLLTKNSYEYAVNTFGVVAAGAVQVLLNQRKSWAEMSHELEMEEHAAILTDTQKPHMNGYEAMKAIRGGRNPLGKAIPIIAMTANAFSDDIQNSIAAGMTYIETPTRSERQVIAKFEASQARTKKKNRA